jgi:hypothetical protein
LWSVAAVHEFTSPGAAFERKADIHDTRLEFPK